MLPKLVNREVKPKNAEFFDEITDILREEGYSNHWHDFRKKMHTVFDELDRARKLAYLVEEEREEDRLCFKMDANGNLTRIEP